VMGVDPHDEATLGHACDLGYAFQLANIARDVREDAEAGRCYLPQDWLDAAGIGSPTVSTSSPDIDFWSDEAADARRQITQRLADKAQRYETSAHMGARKLPFRSRWAVLAAAGIYGDIAREVARRGEKAWDQRVVTTKTAKLGWVARALVAAVI